MKEVEEAFARDMRGIYVRAREDLGYNATFFLRMLSDEGPFVTARKLVHASKTSDGFTALWERRRLDLTVEALVLDERYQDLFDEELRQEARDRLREYGCEL